METGLSLHCRPQFSLLEKAQIYRIHENVLRILNEVGVRIHHPKAVELLADSGAHVEGKDRVRIPPFLVEEAIASAPSNLVIANRRKVPSMELGGRRIHFGTGTDLPKTIDLETREVRDTLAADVVRSTRISDALSHLDFVGSYGLPRDVPRGLHYVRCFQLEVENTTKPVFFTAESEKDLLLILDMAAAVAGSAEALAAHPFLIHYAEPVSPLTHSREALAKLMVCAERRIPVNYTPALLGGSTGPVTLAGALSVAAAEALSGLVVHQLAGKGAPIISGVAATTMDMLHATVSYTSPEFRLTHSAYADLFHHYGLPIWGTAGCSDAHFPDLQAGSEYAFTLLTAALDGSNLIHDCGYMGQGYIAAPEMIVFADEIIGMVKRYMQGFDIDTPHLAFDVIRQVGPGGHFLGEKHTLDFFMKEHWQPGVMNRINLENWVKAGQHSLSDTLIAKARNILQSHEPDPLEEDVGRELHNIWKSASRAGRT